MAILLLKTTVSLVPRGMPGDIRAEDAVLQRWTGSHSNAKHPALHRLVIWYLVGSQKSENETMSFWEKRNDQWVRKESMGGLEGGDIDVAMFC